MSSTYVTTSGVFGLYRGSQPQQISIYLRRTLIDNRRRGVPMNGVDLFGAEDRRPEDFWSHVDNTVKTARVYVDEPSTVALAPHNGLPAMSLSPSQSSHTHASTLNLLRQMTKWCRYSTTMLSREHTPSRHSATSVIDQHESVSSFTLDMERQSSLNTMVAVVTLNDWKRGVTIGHHPSIIRNVGLTAILILFASQLAI